MAETKSTIFSALMEVQKELKPVKKGETADTGKFSYSYADLNSVFIEALPKLHEHGLLLLQPTKVVDTQRLLVTRIVHVESGEAVEGEYPIVSVDDNDPQKVGASVTYSRRYGLLSLLGMATEDDDAQSSSRSFQGHSQASKPSKPSHANRQFDDDGAYDCQHPGCEDTQTGSYASSCYAKYGKVYCRKHWGMANKGELDPEVPEPQSAMDIYRDDPGPGF